MAAKKSSKPVKIKKALGVDSFRNDWEKTTLNLQFTVNWLNQQMRSIYSDLQITYQQAQVLKIIGSSADAVNIETIKAKVTEKDADMSRMIQRLLQMKLITKRIKRTDRRQSEILLNETGRKLLEQIEIKQMEADKLLFNLSKKQLKQLNQLLDIVRS